MALSLRELLEMDVLRRAKPEVVAGRDHLDTPVRWVHTSEIYEIGPLLKGGEVLLTTGLGLVGVGPAALHRYVVELADRGVSGVLLELGRTFQTPPPALVAAADGRDLPLVVLNAVVPFIEVTQAVHEVILNREVARLRRIREIDDELRATLVDDGDIGVLLRRIESLAGAAASLVAADGRSVASSGRRPPALAGGEGHRVERAVLVRGEEWGRLVLHDAPTPSLTLVAERAASVLSLALLPVGGLPGSRTQAATRLLHGLAEGRHDPRAELTAQATAAGLDVHEEAELVGIAVSVDAATPPRTARDALLTAAKAAGLRPAIAADGGEDLLLAAAAPADVGALRTALHAFVTEVERELTAAGGGRVMACAAGPPVRGLPGLVRSLPAAREACKVARHLGLRSRVMLSSDVGLYRLLLRIVDDPELERFLDEQLGPLLDHDAYHGRNLLQTLDAYTEAGGSKTGAAALLGVRRQTVYNRLEQVESLLGRSLADPHHRTALLLALLAWRVRFSGRP